MKWNSVLVIFGLLTILAEINAIRWIKRPQNSHPAAENHPCANKPNWSIVPHAYNCREFFLCVHGDAEEYACMEQQYFDKNTLTCLYGSCPLTDDEDDAAFENKCRPSTTRRVEGNCHYFDYCSTKGEYETAMCPGNSYYDHKALMCRQVDMSANFKCSCLMPEYTILQSETCNSYIACLNGIAELQLCARGQRFDAQINGCVPDLTGECNQTPHKMIVFDESFNYVCQNRNDDGNGEVYFKSHPSDCQKFIICSMGRAIIKHCEEGFYFDITQQMCRLDMKKQCLKQKIQQILVKPAVPIPLNIQELPEAAEKEPEVIEHHQPIVAKPIEPLIAIKPHRPSIVEHQVEPLIAIEPHKPPIIEYQAEPQIAILLPHDKLPLQESNKKPEIVVKKPIVPIAVAAEQKLEKGTHKQKNTNAANETKLSEDVQQSAEDDAEQQSQPRPSILDSIFSFFNFF